MAKLGPYSYPDIRFGDAVEIAGRILSKFKGTVSVKGLAWELGMAENSGTLFAKVAALRDFGLVDGRGELRVTPLAQRVLHPSTPSEARQARAEAFRRVELLRRLYERFQGEVPDDAGLLIGLEEVTKAPRDEIIRRAGLLHKHLADAARVLVRATATAPRPEPSGPGQQNIYSLPGASARSSPEISEESSELYVAAGSARLAVPLTPEYLGVAIDLLQAVKARLEAGLAADGQDVATSMDDEASGSPDARAAESS